MSKLSVIKFLRNCVEYADASIARRKREEIPRTLLLNGILTETSLSMLWKK